MTASDTGSESPTMGRSKSNYPTIETVGVMTAHRPVLLKRALASYIQNTHRGNGIEYVVYDDSKDAAASAASLAVAQDLARKFMAPIRFAGRKERERYARQLSDYSAIPAEILDYALLSPQGHTLGQNRNTMLLDNVGSMIYCADDDTVCAPLGFNGAHVDLHFVSNHDPAEYWCYRNKSEVDALIPFKSQLNALTAHEQLLGKTAYELIDGRPQHFEQGKRISKELMHRLERTDTVVRVTFNGLLGDCAWGSPFGFWHEPMGYLGLGGSSLERLTNTEDFYQEALQSRQLLRVTPGLYLSDASFSMLTFCGLDNRQLLPPNLPSHRGQDLIFGQTLWACFTNSIFGHLPFALIHDPLPPRRFWPGEVTRSASGVDLCRLLIEAMKLLPEQNDQANPAVRLSTLGAHLAQLAQLPSPELAGKLLTALRASNQHFQRTTMARAARIKQAPYYAKDLMQFFAKQNEAECYDHYWIPLDLCGVDGFAAAESRLRRSLEMFGALLEHWPAMVQSARALRELKIRASVAV